MKKYFLGLIIALGLLACTSTKPVVNPEVIGDFVVTDLPGVYVAQGHLRFSIKDDQQISGNTGCNSFFGPYQKENTSLSFESLAVTEKYCNDEGIMAGERAFLEALGETRSFTWEKGELLFLGEEGIVLKAKLENKENTK